LKLKNEEIFENKTMYSAKRNQVRIVLHFSKTIFQGKLMSAMRIGSQRSGMQSRRSTPGSNPRGKEEEKEKRRLCNHFYLPSYIPVYFPLRSVWNSERTFFLNVLRFFGVFLPHCPSFLFSF